MAPVVGETTCEWTEVGECPEVQDMADDPGVKAGVGLLAEGAEAAATCAACAA